MNIRDSHATINNNPETFTLPSGGLQIIADDGRTLWDISFTKDGLLRVSAGHVCKHKGVMLDDHLLIRPNASNSIHLERPRYNA